MEYKDEIDLEIIAKENMFKKVNLAKKIKKIS